ncbi:hypothetical protein DO97_19905 [Neosynechococcus sphagnicola sy1]|uniref:Uncharacterized protein n=1 Tax=Neosynechococcus sphagnicola sy1 TaxID=1497020 RepID=A0A098TM27_9CYAN|nr:hypothetical protein [Neosynechococcus sphagnicola]KGF73370.1 hypothetical protein DO97_19905 [Neosynechococcus sphagnicola sy1]
MSLNIAYIARGKLHLKVNGTPVQVIDSEFGRALQERVLQSQRRNAWKSQGLIESFVSTRGLRKLNQTEDATPQVAFTNLCRSAEGKLFYALEAGEVGGIFSLDQASLSEQRLFHTSDFTVRHLDLHSQQPLLACAISHRTGAVNIATMPIQGSRPFEITEGDSVDLAPHWVAGAARVLVYQSAGIGRDRNGYIRDQAPFTIEKLDLDRQQITTLLADPQFDLLGPQLTSDGTLYYIRRPYRPLHRRSGLLRTLLDIVMMPLWFLYAIFQWINFFTLRYTGKPLMTAGQPQPMDVKQMMVWGNLIDAEQAARRNRFGEADAPALVPRSWQLVRQRPAQQPEVLSEGVLAFDLAADGTLVYANGSAVYCLPPSGVAERLVVDHLIEQVTIL